MAIYNETDILYGPKIVGAQVREIIKGKQEIVPKTFEHIKVNADKCIGCEICYITCPTGSYEMVDGKAEWKFGMERCGECGICRYNCAAGAIDWSYPKAGEGVVHKYS